MQKEKIGDEGKDKKKARRKLKWTNLIESSLKSIEFTLEMKGNTANCITIIISLF